MSASFGQYAGALLTTRVIPFGVLNPTRILYAHVLSTSSSVIGVTAATLAAVGAMRDVIRVWRLR